jgi:hypothetical protein
MEKTFENLKKIVDEIGNELNLLVFNIFEDDFLEDELPSYLIDDDSYDCKNELEIVKKFMNVAHSVGASLIYFYGEQYEFKDQKGYKASLFFIKDGIKHWLLIETENAVEIYQNINRERKEMIRLFYNKTLIDSNIREDDLVGMIKKFMENNGFIIEFHDFDEMLHEYLNNKSSEEGLSFAISGEIPIERFVKDFLTEKELKKLKNKIEKMETIYSDMKNREIKDEEDDEFKRILSRYTKWAEQMGIKKVYKKNITDFLRKSRIHDNSIVDRIYYTLNEQ